MEVGQATRLLQSAYGITHATPVGDTRITAARLRPLVSRLDTMTSDLLRERETLSDFVPDAGVLHWDSNMAAWRARLQNYETILNGAPDNDSELVRYTVAAPLLLGWYPDRPRQTVLDAVTPWILAGGLVEAKRARDHRWSQLVADVSKGVQTVGGVLPWVAAGVGLVVLLRILR